MTVTFEQAKELLAGTERRELKDHAFGDREIYFTKGDKNIAEGYSGGGNPASIMIYGEQEDGSDATHFEGSEAAELNGMGTFMGSERNDSTGPDDFEEGECMPGLTLEVVRQELEGE